MFAILDNGLESGAYNLDKVNDYVKEFGNSLVDGRIGDNLSSFSDKTKTLFYNWKSGKATTKDVFYSVIKDLSTMTNKQEALTIASNTWSSLGEDNAMDVITSLSKVNTAYDDVRGTMEKIKEIKYDSLSNKYEQLGRKFQTEVGVPIAEDFFPVVEEGLELLIDNVDKIIPVIGGVGSALVALKAKSAVTDVVDKFSQSTETATIAQKAFNAVCTGNPVAIASAAVGTAAVAYGVYYSQLDFVEGKTSEVIRKNQELSDSMVNISEDADQINLDWSDSLGDMETQSQAAKNLTDKLAELDEKTEKTSDDKMQMKVICEELNSIFPDLALSVDEETGALNKNIDTIYKSIEASEAYTKAKAAQEKLEEIAKKQVDAEMALAEAELKLQDTQERGEVLANLHRQAVNDATLTDVDRTNKLEQLEQQQRLLNDSEQEIQESMGETQETLSGLGEQYSTIYDFKQEQIEKSGEVSQAYSDEAAAAEEGAETVNTAMQLQTEYFGAASEAALTSAATIADTYEDIKESVTGALESQMDMFSAFDEGTKLSTDEMLQNMQSQIDGVENWSENLKILAERGINENLLQYLAEMGPQGAGYVATFVEMGSTELEKASELWSQSLDIKGGVSEKISGMMEEVTTAISGGTEQVQSILQQCGYDSITGLVNGVTEYLSKVEDAGMEIGDTVVGATKTALDSHSPSVVMEGIGQDASVGLSNGILSKIGSIQNSSEMVANYALSATTSILQREAFYNIGQNVSQGLAQGILDGQSAVVNAVASMCASAVTEAKKDLDINSPSKVFEEIGMYSAQGFGGGFENEMVSVAQSVKDSMNFESTEKVYSAQNTDTGNLENTIENALYNGLIYAMSKVNMAPNLNGLTVIGQYDGENVVKIVVNADESEKARTGGIGLFA